MREIEFRGIKIYSNEWVYGNLIQNEKGEKYIIPFNVIEEDGHHLVINNDIPVFIKQETVGQYTGLKDKNGVKIFEGDILEAVVNNSIDLRLKGEPKCIAHWTVEYRCFQNNIGFMVYGKDRRWNRLLMINMIYNCKVQVIGNIYENPELLKKGD